LQIPTINNLLIPAGLSFYTFQKVAFAVDTLKNKLPLPKPLDYLNFAGFFAQIVAGPIPFLGLENHGGRLSVAPAQLGVNARNGQ
jgi:D-alanyl-lipoteichoic acid acyltransferase DltB (MBOAT superfamily)